MIALESMLQICSFWQYPAATEYAASLAVASVNHDSFIYIPLPWATAIDLSVKYGLNVQQHAQWNFALSLSSAKARSATSAVTVSGSMHVATVCQHIHWELAVPWFKSVGITDLFLSHCPIGKEGVLHEGLRLHPWPLFAVNVEDHSRNSGIQIGKPNNTKKHLASFIGAHADHYLSNHRKRLLQFADTPGFYIQVGDTWHFERQVYQQQLNGLHAEAALFDQAAVQTYNEVLSNSVFSLCPAGAGANTIRLWESLAVGAIPVVLGPRPALPMALGAGLPNWEDALLFVDDAQFDQLPQVLAGISQAERDARQQACLALYAATRRYTPVQALGV